MKKLRAYVGVEHFEGLFGIDNTRDYRIEAHRTSCDATTEVIKERAEKALKEQARN